MRTCVCECVYVFMYVRCCSPAIRPLFLSTKKKQHPKLQHLQQRSATNPIQIKTIFCHAYKHWCVARHTAYTYTFTIYIYRLEKRFERRHFKDYSRMYAMHAIPFVQILKHIEKMFGVCELLMNSFSNWPCRI